MDYKNTDDSVLIAAREVLLDEIERGKNQEFIDNFHKLLEIERELTLREDR